MKGIDFRIFQSRFQTIWLRHFFVFKSIIRPRERGILQGKLYFDSLGSSDLQICTLSYSGGTNVPIQVPSSIFSYGNHRIITRCVLIHFEKTLLPWRALYREDNCCRKIFRYLQGYIIYQYKVWPPNVVILVQNKRCLQKCGHWLTWNVSVQLAIALSTSGRTPGHMTYQHNKIILICKLSKVCLFYKLMKKTKFVSW